jgi:hypothetical protein
VVEIAGRPDRVEELRHDVDVNSEAVGRVDHLRELLGILAGECDHYAVGAAFGENAGKVFWHSEHGKLGEFLANGSRLRIDETDHTEPKLRVLGKLARHELADVSGADDHGALRKIVTVT